MRKDRLYILFMATSIIVFVAVEIMKPKPVNWSTDYTQNKSIPYASKILYEELGTLFPGSEIIDNSKTLYEFEDEQDLYSENWIFINSELEFDEFDTDILLDQVESGDDAFLAGVISGKLADTLNLDFEYFYSMFDSTTLKDEMHLSFNDPAYVKGDGWKLSTRETFYHITSYDSSITTELGGWEEYDMLNFIALTWGEGTIYIHSNPNLFTNYYMRDPELAPYAFSALSRLPVRTTVWDEYYKDGKEQIQTPLTVLLSSDSLRYAWQLGFFTLILFMIFKSKRVQRIIPIVKAPENSSLNFAKTIGQLYVEQGTHKDIFDKKIQFFFDYIKSNLRLDPEQEEETFKKDISARSGIELTQINKLFDLIELTQRSTRITDTELKLVTDNIDQFYKNSQR